MMRWVLGLLLLANGLFFAWSHGYGRAFGLGPTVQSEPLRLQQQILPEAITVVTQQTLQKAESQAVEDAKPRQCLVLGPFDDAQVAALRTALQASSVPPQAWQLNTVNTPARWLVYIGKFANEAAQLKKRTELLGINIKSDPAVAPALAPGLSLGRFESEAQANDDLARLRKLGVRTARVVLERAASQSTQLKLPAATDAVRTQVLALGDALAGKAPRNCE